MGTLINQAHGNATPFEGCRIVVVRLYPPPALDTLYAATAAPRLQSKRKARSRLAFQRRAKPLRKTELSVVDMSARGFRLLNNYSAGCSSCSSHVHRVDSGATL